MLALLYLYGIIGIAGGLAIFSGDLCSICVPGNTRVDPHYVWSEQSFDKLQDCLVISLVKGICAGATWPIVTYKAVSDLVYDRGNFGHFMQLGYFKSPHYLNKKNI